MRKINAFTLIELLVVIAIIGILSALIIIGMNSTTQKATIAKAQAFTHSLDGALMSSKVSEWKFESGTHTDGQSADTTDIKDTWGTNDASVVSGPLIKEDSNCVSEKCLNFDGNDSVNLGNSASLQQITNVVTISAWIKTTQTTAATIVDKYGSGSYGPMFQINTYTIGRLYFLAYELSSGKSMDGEAIGGINILDNKWHNVVAVADCPSQTLTFYKDGEKSVVTGRNNIVWGTGGNLYIGYRNKVGSESYLNGSIDDISIYNSAIPTSQIQQNYYAGLNKLFAKRRVEISEYQQRVASLDQNFNVSEHN